MCQVRVGAGPVGQKDVHQQKMCSLKTLLLLFSMYKKIKFLGIQTENPSLIFANTTVLYNLNITEPLLCSQDSNEPKKGKKDKWEGRRQKGVSKGGATMKESQEGVGKAGRKAGSGGLKSKWRRSQCLLEGGGRKEGQWGKGLGQGDNKIIINSNFLHQMRKRNSNSEMKHYRQPIKVDTNDELPKKRRNKLTDQAHSFRKLTKNTVQIAPNYTALSQINKKNSKNTLKTNKHPSSFSTKLNKTEFKSTELLQDRRCKSSLKQKKASKLLNDLKQIGKSLPLASKLNSLYSNTTSIYNSKSYINNTQRFAYRIPTQEPSDQMQQIRKYESLILADRSISLMRSRSKQSLAKSLEETNTQQIISSYIERTKIQPFANLSTVNEKQDCNHIYSETGSNVMLKEKGRDSSIIDRLGQDREEEQLSKLNSIISIIQKNENNLLQQDRDKIISTIKELLQGNPKKEQQQTHLGLDAKGKEGQSDTSLKNDFSSEGDISVVNLQVLDKALRDREEYLQRRLKKEIEAIEEEDGRDDSEQAGRISKWINHQIKQVRSTRIHLWKGFNLAKNLLNYTQLSSKNRHIMKSLSEKYIKSTSLTRIPRERQELSPKGAQIQQKEPSLEEGRIVEDSDDEESSSSMRYSPLLEHDSLHLQDLKFLSSDKYQLSQEKGSKEQADSLVINSQSKIGSQEIERNLQRERLKCESPCSDSNQSYGAIIIERQDTFLFSSQKKTQNSFIHLSDQDKEDICEFIFLELCLQISQKSPQSPSSRIGRSISQFMAGVKERSKRSKGFKTNPTAIKQYLTHFINFLKTKPQVIEQIHDTLDRPMGPTALQILKYMHTFNEDIEEEQDAYILTSTIFDMFEDSYMRTIKIERYYDEEEREIKRRNFIKNAIHIHNKAIYDAYNQTLDRDRPYGMWGEPFSWKKTAKFAHKRDTKTKNDIILKRAQQTIEYSHFMCGFMLDKQDCIFKNNPQITESYIEQVRHDRLSQLMAKELHECEQKMQFFDDQETEILVSIGQFIFVKLLSEASSELILLK